MGLISWIVIGLIAGVLARAIVPGKQAIGWIATLVLGLVGAVIGGFVGQAIWGRGVSFSLGGLLISVLGAIVVLFAYGAITSRGHKHLPA